MFYHDSVFHLNCILLFPFFFSFKKLVAFWEEEMKCQSISATEKLKKEPVLENKEPICFKDDEISCIIKDLLDPSAGFARSKALQKYLSVGEWFYKESHQLDDQIRHFEANIHRSYFHVKPLDSSQLENWHNYLDFVEMHGDFDWVKYYPCAYVDYACSPPPPLLPPLHSLPTLRISNTHLFLSLMVGC